MSPAAGSSCSACTLPHSTVSDERSAWSEHPHYPRQTLLLGSHRNFLAISDQIIADTEQLVDDNAQGAALLQTTRWLFEAWQRAMSSHEHYEEHKLYRYLAHRFGGSFTCLEDEHHALHAARDEVRAAYAEADGPALLAALRRHREVLRAHLDHEERVVIPLLLQMEPEEFDRYYHSPISLLLSRSSNAVH